MSINHSFFGLPLFFFGLFCNISSPSDTSTESMDVALRCLFELIHDVILGVTRIGVISENQL